MTLYKTKTFKTAGWFIAAILCACIGIASIGVGVPAAATQPSAARRDYSRLLAFIQAGARQDPLLLFNQYEGDPNHQRHRENVAYLNNHQELLNQIKAKLSGDKLQWKIDQHEYRLLFVPEQRPEYAALYESYCHDVVDYVLGRTQLPNPYAGISTLTAAPESIPQTSADGIHAYLVHNLASDYVEEFLFFNTEPSKKIKLRLNNRVFVGEVGSYTSNLYIRQEGKFEFVKEPYTIWQNNSDNPHETLIVPIEETLHIALRDHTERAIQVSLHQQKPGAIDLIEQIVEDWIAVEEAIVGGMVNHLMPEVMDKYLNTPDTGDIARTLAQRHEFSQYRYLKKGIQVVDDLGLTAALKLYQDQPVKFKHMLK